MKYLLRKGRPDSADLRRAQEFALKPSEKMNAGNS